MKKYFYVYKVSIINAINKETFVYIGKHETFDIDDTYYGSGTAMNFIRKIITDNNLPFDIQRDVVEICESSKELSKVEIELIKLQSNNDKLHCLNISGIKNGSFITNVMIEYFNSGNYEYRFDDYYNRKFKESCNSSQNSNKVKILESENMELKKQNFQLKTKASRLEKSEKSSNKYDLEKIRKLNETCRKLKGDNTSLKCKLTSLMKSNEQEDYKIKYDSVAFKYQLALKDIAILNDSTKDFMEDYEKILKRNIKLENELIPTRMEIASLKERIRLYELLEID